MFSYLRPRSRHGATNPSETPDLSKAPLPVSEYSIQPTQPRQLPPASLSQPISRDETHSSPVSIRAPTLPPIPRVASIYGAPDGASISEEQRNGKTAEHYHSRVQSIDEDKASSQFGSSPMSTPSVAGVRPKNNFSRPFQAREGSTTPSEDRGNLQEIWRSAAQEAQSTDMYIGKGKRPQPVLDTSMAAHQTMTEPTRNGNRVLRMPFQETSESSPMASPSPSSLKPTASTPHHRQASEGSILQSSAYTRTSFTKTSESQLSLPMSRGKDAASPTFRNATAQASASSTQAKPSRLTRLNPMALLSRRRSSQPSPQPVADPYRRNPMLGSTLPQDYVGIRGNRVHDFSAPRARKVVSQQTTASGSSERLPDGTHDLLHVRTTSQGSSSLGVPSPSPERRIESPRVHTPVFREYIDDTKHDWPEQNPEAKNKQPAAVVDVSSDEYTDSSYDSESEEGDASTFGDPLLLGDATFGLFSDPGDTLASQQEFSFIVPEHLAGPPPPPRGARSRSSTPNQDRSPRARSFHPPMPAPRTPRSRSQTPSTHERSPRDARAPRSASTPPLRESRTPSPQLHLPRHSKSNASRFSFDLAGFGSAQEKLLEDKHREKISKGLRASKISEMSVPETADGFDSDGDPDFGNDIEEDIPGMNMDEDEFPMAKSIANSTLDSSSAPQASKGGLYTHQNVAMSLGQSSSADSAVPKPSKSFILRGSMFPSGAAQYNNSDDFYFDDGAIEDADLATTGEFDESVFDDPTHRSGQRIQPSLPIVAERASENSSLLSTRPMSQESIAQAASHGHQESTDTSRTSLPPAQSWEKPTAVKRSSMLKNDLAASRDVPADLTHGNLAAYHDALALAAQKAATEGRFDRDGAPEELTPAVGLPANISNNTLGLQVDNEFAPYDDSQDRVTFDDYEQEDDDVIAAANADALEYDGDFYGQEFSFYSSADGGEDSKLGGRFVSDVKRSHSGRENGQDPSLTPITEMSEWSTRNSMVSFSMDRNHGASFQQLGLAQIKDSLRDDEEDLSLSSLKRLRQNAFAGSASSLGSGGSGKNGSPPSSSSPLTPRPGTGHGRSSTERSHPLRNQSSDQNNLILSSPQSGSEASPSIKRAFVKGHSRNSSGAESVAYVQENDAEGSRWVLERRRMAEDGSIEVLGRQVVEGGRI